MKAALERSVWEAGPDNGCCPKNPLNLTHKGILHTKKFKLGQTPHSLHSVGEWRAGSRTPDESFGGS